MIVVQISDPEDGRVSHEVGPFDLRDEADGWRLRFLMLHDYDQDFVEVRDIDFRLYNPRDAEAMQEIEDFYQ